VTDTPDNDARLTRYLLGEVSEHERQTIERECFRADGEAFAELAALEDELRVAYAQRRLSAADRVAFERKYLTTVSDRARLAFAQALSTMADREPAVGRGVAAMPPVRWWRRPAVTIGLAAATVVLGLATGALVLSNQRLRSDQTVPRPICNRSSRSRCCLGSLEAPARRFPGSRLRTRLAGFGCR
jgi:hypothetical protein